MKYLKRMKWNVWAFHQKNNKIYTSKISNIFYLDLFDESCSLDV